MQQYNDNTTESIVIHPKVTAAVWAGSLVTIGAWAAQAFGHVTIPPEIEGAAITVISAFAGFFANNAL